MRPTPLDLGPEDDPRVLAAAREYLAELEAGRRPDPAHYGDRHPELAGAIAECLAGIDLAHMLRGPESPEALRQPLGDFQIVGEIARGGMGVVYEAIQLSLGRRVALKVLPFAAALDARHLQRFKTEAHAAALLHHSNIVPIHAVGCERGVHFYAMQLIEGRSLDAVLRERRGEGLLAPKLRPGPEWYRTVARLGMDVALALDYAHSQDVVHRDIKPANLILDGAGKVWVTDFGLAQVSTDAGLTHTGDLVGTLRYMSPEQASGRRAAVDHRTDVYSLGATLYELLGQEPLFIGNDRAALLRQILEMDPRPLRARDPSVPDELDVIVQKALAKLPAERYATAADMAEDLRRFLEARPILARRPTLLERSRKWARRHPGLLAAAGLASVLVICGLAVATALVSKEQRRTRAALDSARERAREAEARFALARRVADDLVQISEEELAGNPFQENVRRRLLDAALVYYREFIAIRENDLGARAELGQARDRVAGILRDLDAIQGDRQMHLVAETSVQDDLDLDEQQRELIAELVPVVEDRRRSMFPRLRDLGAEERTQRFVEEARANGAVLSAILDPGQVQRLRQIQLQCRGAPALLEPDVALALRLSPEQREEIRSLEFDPDRARPGPSGSRPPMPLDEDLRAGLRRALAVLTAEQRLRWDEIAGPPFEGSLTRTRPLTGRGRSGGGPPR
jgi:hypothetical protein